MKQTYLIKQDYTDTRLDRWFKKKIAHIPQSLIEKTLRKGKIKVNNKRKKSSYKLQLNDQIDIYNFSPTIKISSNNKYKYNATKKEIKVTSNFVLEDNKNFIVINKPAGISVQSGTKSRRNILDILRKTKHFKDTSPYTVHRLDKETTGILIVAKNRKYAQLFTSLFRIRKIHKTYLCIVMGEMKKSSGTFIDNLYYYEDKKEITAKAITHFKVLDSNGNYSLLLLNPITGRKHQIRKQLLIHNHPVLGDDKYRMYQNVKRKNNSLMLHSFKINFSINEEKYKFIAEPSDQFKKTMKEKYLKSFLL